MQTILNIRDGSYGLRYLKIVKSSNGPHYVIDVMFTMGFRIFVDVLPGDRVSKIGLELTDKLYIHRPSEASNIKPSIDFVAECMSRVLSDERGLIAARHLESDTLREAWDATLFRCLLLAVDPNRTLDYETVIEAVELEFKQQIV
jgi:hypothetical protein